MKAYNCDNCKKYFSGSPAGVLYDNVREPGHGVRFDLCRECLEKISSDIPDKQSSSVPTIEEPI